MAGLTLHFSRTLDSASWARRHDLGEVPDQWPYGLHHLRDHGLTVRPAHGRARRLVRVVRKLGGGYDWDRALTGGEAALCWDERTGVPVALSGVPTLTGAIWLTEPRRAVSDRVVARRALARCEMFVLSQDQVGILASQWGVPRRRIHHVPFGIDPDFWFPAEGRRNGVLVVGNDRHRDHATAIRAAHMAGARLTLVTNQPVQVPRVSLTHPQLRRAYADHGVVALATTPNHHASGVTTLLEAMACARPVVATRGGGLEPYAPPESTVLVDPGDSRAMADAIAALLSDPARATEMGLAGRDSVEAQFASARMAADLACLVRGLR